MIQLNFDFFFLFFFFFGSVVVKSRAKLWESQKFKFRQTCPTSLMHQILSELKHGVHHNASILLKYVSHLTRFFELSIGSAVQRQNRSRLANSKKPRVIRTQTINIFSYCMNKQGVTNSITLGWEGTESIQQVLKDVYA